MARELVKYRLKKRRTRRVREETLVGVGAGASSGGPPFKLSAETTAIPAISPDGADIDAVEVADSPALREIEALNAESEKRWRHKLVIANELTRALVSFQANKSRAVYRWYKYKEAFSAELVEHLLNRYKLSSGVLLDPFAGSGTALFAAGALGLKAEGIELLPIGQNIIETKQLIDWELRPSDKKTLARWARQRPWQKCRKACALNELRITKGAYPKATVEGMGKYLTGCQRENDRVKAVLRFALLCILESISYTRKDGQYLRWDYRSGRKQGKKIFDKGRIAPFDEAITAKLNEIVGDLGAASVREDLLFTTRSRADVVLHSGSCLEIMPTFEASAYDCIFTSPPYCNRYDYTRTYALELALLGVTEEGLVRLRQDMLSCTVENRTKDLLALNPNWEHALAVANEHPLLQRILSYLDAQRKLDLLNNNGIPRMVRGYFYEMACVIAECARFLKRGAPLIMVNDNVRYAGASVAVDLILSEMAEQLGFTAENIFVLPNGKGNSSQQMGAHGRDPLRKCVYVWRRR
jgi:DNA modification methylase